MSTLQFGGLISGLKTSDIIDALMAVQKQPLARLQAKEADLTTQKTAYGQLRMSIDSLISTVKAFTTSNAGASRFASSANNSLFTASASAGVAVGQYQVHVDRLATTTIAKSTAAIGSAITVAVDPSKTLDGLMLGAPVTTGTTTVTVDGVATQVSIGPTGTTTLQSVMNSIAGAIEQSLNTGGDNATVTASIVDNKLQLAVTGGTGAAHTISFGDVADTSNAAAALGLDTQGVTGVANATITGTSYLDARLSSLNTPGSISGGQISAIVDGVIVRYAVGDPDKTSLGQVLDGFESAIQAQLRAGGPNKAADATATVTASVTVNRAQIGIAGAGTTHTISFGAASDTSNALAVLGLANESATNAMNPTVTASVNLGVVRTTSALDSAGLTGLASTQTGVLTINGVQIGYDTTADSLTTVISRINSSAAGVVASIDRTNDQIVLTRKDTGALAIDIQDTGTLAAALNLAPGTTNAQIIGRTAQVTVDGRTVVSTSNSVTNAIDGVTINLLDDSPTADTTTLTVGVDKQSITSAVNKFISAFNSLGDTLNDLTKSTPGTSGGNAGSSGPLAADPTALTMLLGLRDLVMSAIGSSDLDSLGGIGVNSGAVGAAVGSTDKLQLDGSKLAAALDRDASKVASLLDGATGPMGMLLDRLKTYDNPDDTTAHTYINSHTDGIDDEVRTLKSQETDMQTRIDTYQAALEAKYAALEATLAQLQTQSSAVSSQIAGFNKSA